MANQLKKSIIKVYELWIRQQNLPEKSERQNDSASNEPINIQAEFLQKLTPERSINKVVKHPERISKKLPIAATSSASVAN